MSITTDALVARAVDGSFLFKDNDECDRLQNPGYLGLTVSIMILVGLLISYLPQHWRIISRRTSEGISPYFILLGVTSATSSFGNIVMLPRSQEDIACCTSISTFECLAGLLGIAQFAVQFFCFAFILVLFLVFFRLDDAAVPDVELDHEHQPRWQTALMVAWICLLHGVIVLTISIVLFIAKREQLGAWANLLGIEASMLAVVQYAPQIWTTYTLKHVGSLSIPMMCIQTPGGFLFVGSLYARLGLDGWSNWGIILVTATSQGVLLCMAVYYEVVRKTDESALSQHIRTRASSTSAPQNGHGTTNPDRVGGYGTMGSESGSRSNSGRQQSPIRIDHRIYGPNGMYDPDMPGPYTGHPNNYAETPEEYETLMSREDSQAAAEDAPLLRRGGIGDPRRHEPRE